MKDLVNEVLCNGEGEVVRSRNRVVMICMSYRKASSLSPEYILNITISYLPNDYRTTLHTIP